MNVLITLFIAAAGACFFLVLKIPGSLMVGAMIATAAFHLATGNGQLPPGTPTLVQYLLGCYIGTLLHKSDLQKLKTLAAPAAILTLCMTAYAVGAGFVFHLTTGCDILTALYSTAPGGMVEVCIFAGDTGADSSSIAAFHTLRTAILYFLVPVLATIFLKNSKKAPGDSIRRKSAPPKAGKKALAGRALLTLAAGAAGAAAGKVSGIPAGTLLATIIATGFFSLATEKAYIPLWLKRGAQILSGAVVGLRCSAAGFLQAGSALPHMLAVILGFLLLTLVLGKYLSKKGYVDLPTGIFSCCAGGVSDITLVASDYDVDTTDVVLLQLVRYFSIFITYPVLGAIFT